MPRDSIKAMKNNERLRRLLHRYRFLWENSARKPTGHPDDPYEATGDALIHHLVRFGPLGDLELLLSGGADINLRGELKYTPLHWAISTENLPALKLLLRAGANPLIPDIWGRTALAAAQSEGSGEVTSLLADAVQKREADNREDGDKPPPPQPESPLQTSQFPQTLDISTTIRYSNPQSGD